MTHENIALIGKKRSGKGSVASILHRRYGHEVMSFADPLRELVQQINPLVFMHWRHTDILDAFGYEHAKDNYPELRRILQNVGHGVRQVLGEDTWVDHLVERMTTQRIHGYDGSFVVDDCRYVNEVEALKYHDFLVVRVVRPDLEDDRDTHITETALDNFPEDVLIINDGDLDDLDGEVTAHLGSLAFL